MNARCPKRVPDYEQIGVPSREPVAPTICVGTIIAFTAAGMQTKYNILVLSY